MKLYTTAILFVFASLFVFFKCDSEPKNTNLHMRPHEATEKKQNHTAYDSTYYKQLFVKIKTLEDSLQKYPANKKLIYKLLTVSYDTVSGSFFTVGKGVYNKSMPEPARNSGRKLASEYTAKRWALYLKSWHIGKIVNIGMPIEGKVMYSKPIYRTYNADTLFTLVQIPIGSIVVYNVYAH